VYTTIYPFFPNVIFTERFSSLWIQGKVNGILKQRWLGLSDDERSVWKRWQIWDSLRYRRDCSIHEAKKTAKKSLTVKDSQHGNHDAIPKKRSHPESSPATNNNVNGNAQKSSFHIPKKKRLPS